MIFIKRLFLVTTLLLVSHLPAFSATFTWTGTVSKDWLTAGNWSPAGPPGPSDTAIITTGTPIVTGTGSDVFCDTVFLSGGSLDAGTGLNVTNVLNFTGGTLAGKLTIGAGATMVLSNASAVNLSVSRLVNFGSVQWKSGSLQLAAGAFLTNNGAWLIQSNSAVNAGGNVTFYNNASGVVSKTGSGTTTFNNLAFFNAGALQVSAGTLQLNAFSVLNGTVAVPAGTLTVNGGGYWGGSFTAGAGAIVQFTSGNFTNDNAQFTGAGAFKLTGGALTLTNDLSPALQLRGGTVAVGPLFQNNGSIASLSLNGASLIGTNNVSGTLNWVAGGINGVLNIAKSAVLNISGSSSVQQGGSITNAGQILWSGPCNWNLASGATVNNLGAGLIDIQYDQVMNASSATLVNNAGLIRKSGGPGTTTIDPAVINSGAITVLNGTLDFRGGGTFGGTINVANGAFASWDNGGVLSGSFLVGYGGSINLNGGAFSFGPSVTFGGAGVSSQFGGSLTLLDNPIPNLLLKGGSVILPPTFQGGSIANLTLTNNQVLTGSNYITGVLNFRGTATGPLVVAPGGTLNWSGGTGQGSLTVLAGGTLNFPSANTVYLDAAVTNFGAVNFTGGYVQLLNNLTFYNELGASLNFLADQTFYNYNGGETVNNLGLIKKSGTTGVTYFDPILINNGTVEVDSGTLNFYGNSTGAQLNGQFLAEAGGTIIFGDGGSLAGTYNAAGGLIELQNGAFNLTAAASFVGSGTNLMVGGSLTLANTNVPGLQIAGGTFSLAPGFQGGVITNLTLNGNLSGSNYLDGSLTLNGNINGPLTLSPRSVVTWMGGTMQAALTIPAGAIFNFNGNGTFAVNASLTNNGTINWRNGDIAIQGAFSFNNLQGAAFNVMCDRTLYGSYSTAYLNNAGEIHKFGASNNTYVEININNLGRCDVDSGEISFRSAFYDGTGANYGGLLHTASNATINIDYGGQLSGVFSNELGGSLTLSGGYFTNLPTVVFTGAGSSVLTGGYVTLDSNSIPNLSINGQANVVLGPNFQGGSITNFTVGGYVSGNTTVSGAFTNTEGGISGNLIMLPGATVTLGGVSGQYVTVNAGPIISSGSVLNIAGSGYLEFSAGLTNDGVINWTGSEMYVGNGATAIFENAGVFNIQCDSSLGDYYYYNTGAQLNNDGAIVKSAGVNTTIFTIPLQNAGTVDAQSGAIYFNFDSSSGAAPVLGGSFQAENGGSILFTGGGALTGHYTAGLGGIINLEGGNFTNTPATRFSGAGINELTGGTLYLTTNLDNVLFYGGVLIPTNGFSLDSLGNLNLNGTSLGGSNTINGSLTLTGSIEGALTVNGTLNFNGYLTSGQTLTLTPGSTLNWTNGGVYTPFTVPAGATVNLL
ncbi:MAG TPA: hypothetical protein VHB20_08985, partial [Verrucomicrobiae bacterium]|nr:hypothetical protein [Verrucomicrobiae bacterium]